MNKYPVELWNVKAVQHEHALPNTAVTSPLRGLSEQTRLTRLLGCPQERSTFKERILAHSTIRGFYSLNFIYVYWLALLFVFFFFFFLKHFLLFFNLNTYRVKYWGEKREQKDNSLKMTLLFNKREGWQSRFQKLSEYAENVETGRGWADGPRRYSTFVKWRVVWEAERKVWIRGDLPTAGLSTFVSPQIECQNDGYDFQQVRNMTQSVILINSF